MQDTLLAMIHLVSSTARLIELQLCHLEKPQQGTHVTLCDGATVVRAILMPDLVQRCKDIKAYDPSLNLVSLLAKQDWLV